MNYFIWTALAFFVFVPFSVITFAYTRTDSVPKWNRYIGLLTIISSITVIYFVGKELVFCLESLGIILNRSHTFIGCTFYTWGNGLSDFMANISLAKQGYPRMAFSACFGVCIFSKSVQILNSHMLYDIVVSVSSGTFASICIPILYQAINSKSGVVKVVLPMSNLYKISHLLYYVAHWGNYWWNSFHCPYSITCNTYLIWRYHQFYATSNWRYNWDFPLSIVLNI